MIYVRDTAVKPAFGTDSMIKSALRVKAYFGYT